ncbi:MAG: tRNA (adenosine(37)-N6)-threonylcarbamoyltransferase complex dimerization subunit type 1 TsaB [Planctomycetes bacterium]|nr:tRNA (adenosine(37)-N6)-threonylcarbamoyltransferase complex dimerization subunit type 1 TsaB [Planctomycetota bacterium]
MATFLALELASSCCTVAVSHAGQLTQHDFSDERGRGVICAVEKILAELSIEPTSLDAIYVGIGPGSYTGLRIACSAATMLAYSLNIDCHGVSSFEALAWRSAQQQPFSILLDAYRQQYYHAEYIKEKQTLICLQAPQIIEQDSWNHEKQAHHPDTTAKDILNFVLEFICKDQQYASKHLFQAEPLYLRPPAFRQEKKARLNK